MNDTPLLKTPGEMISEARGTLGLTLAQLSDRTKIPPPVLAALELDEYHKISGPLYIKSFLRTCALDLGLDPETVLGLYNKISGEKKQGSPGSETVWGEDDVQVSRIGLPWLKIVMAVGIGALLIGVGLFAFRGCGKSDPAPENESPALADKREVQPALETPDESTVPAETVAISQDEAANDGLPVDEEQPVDDVPVVLGVPSEPDTLALGWVLSPDLPEAVRGAPEPSAAAVQETRNEPQQEPVQDTVEETEPESAPEPALEPSPEPTPEPTQEQVAETDPTLESPVVISGPSSAENEAVAEPADRRDSSWPLVLSITCPSPQDIRVKRDADRTFSTVRWPGEGESAPEIPVAGFEAGRAYREDNRWVIFWGGNDHFGVILDRVPGVTITLNGWPYDTARLKPGQEFLLDAFSIGAKTDR